MRIRTGTARAAMAALTLLVAGGLSTPAPAAPTNTNLVKNPDFESSPLPEAVRRPAPGVDQPVLPTDWIFEGASELFDHAATHPPFSHHGSYFVQISGAWSGPKKDCSAASAAAGAPCLEVPAPVQQQREGLAQYYSVAPAWRPIDGIPVQAGKEYTFSSWISTSIPLDGTGAVTKVRWLDANGVPIAIANGPSLVAPSPSSGAKANYTTFAQQSAMGPGPFKDHSVPWSYRKAFVTAPDRAARAILLLGFSDSAWIGSASYDYVCFSLRPTLASNDICQTTYAS